PGYQWKVNGNPAGFNSPEFYTYPANNDEVTCVLTSNDVCISGNPATSAPTTMVIHPWLPVGISVAASSNPVCTGSLVTFTATSSNGGTTPAYQWNVNGGDIPGATDASYTYIPANNDAIKCVLTSNEACLTVNPATSNSVIMSVEPLLPVGISISASANPVDQGTSVTFTATPVNEGLSPVYQWKLNNANTGTNAVTFTYVPADGDQVSCVLTSAAACVSGNPASSDVVTMAVSNVPAINNINDITVPDARCFNASHTISVAGNGSIFSVPLGGSVTMIAGENILYYPGTKVDSGGYMLGYIAPGGPYCPPPAKASVVAGNSQMPGSPERNFFRIYPNPTTGEFTLALEGYVPSEKVIVGIYNMNGEKIISSEMMDELKHEFSLSEKPAGLYLVRVTSESQSGSTRIMKVD
ncbi:MAG: T9SS type A sorting domain-containing protein, partial [Bacteroidetes bacterium]|nr:T9SS type A sorting domain-containing protein [Bacteroidota bacterium]